MTNNENLFDEISKLLSSDNEPNDAEQDRDERSPSHLIDHPFMGVRDDGVPVIIHDVFSTFMPPYLYDKMKAEGMAAHQDVVAFVDAIMEVSSVEEMAQTTGRFTRVVTGSDRVDGTEAAIWLARFTMLAAAMASVAMIKGLSPGPTGIFHAADALNIMAGAEGVIRLAQAIAAPIRAEWGVAEGGSGHDLR